MPVCSYSLQGSLSSSENNCCLIRHTEWLTYCPLGGGGPNPGQHWIYSQLGTHSQSKARGKEGVMSYSEEAVAV